MMIITPRETIRPQTFFLKCVQKHDRPYYQTTALAFLEEVKKEGLNPRLKVTDHYNPKFYITFASKYDAMAFKLKWM